MVHRACIGLLQNYSLTSIFFMYFDYLHHILLTLKNLLFEKSLFLDWVTHLSRYHIASFEKWISELSVTHDGTTIEIISAVTFSQKHILI